MAPAALLAVPVISSRWGAGGGRGAGSGCVCAHGAAGQEKVVWGEVSLEKSSELKPFSIRL